MNQYKSTRSFLKKVSFICVFVKRTEGYQKVYLFILIFCIFNILTKVCKCLFIFFICRNQEKSKSLSTAKIPRNISACIKYIKKSELKNNIVNY